MLRIKIGKGGIERALKEYKSKLIRTKQLKELKENQRHEKLSAKKESRK